MTQRLYYLDSYLKEFEAEVVDRAEGGRRIYLNQTAFYPTSGGQPFDTGELGGIEVKDVVDEGDRVAHLLATPLAANRVTGKIDWPRRVDYMQQHTGQHLLSAVLANLFGHQTTAVHFGRESSTLDLNSGTFAPEQVAQAVVAANAIVTQNRPVEVSFEDAEAATGLRKASERTGRLRIVMIRDLDRSACGGTHVRATGEVGAILIRKVERARKGVRLEFLCGQRAITRAHEDFVLLSRLASDLSSSLSELPQVIAAQRTELKEFAARSRENQEKLDLCRAQELYGATTPDAAGIRRVVVQQDASSLEELRGLASAFISLPMSIFVGTVVSPPSILLAASVDTGIDAAALLKSLLATVNGRGGGSARLAQGIVPGTAQLQEVVTALG
jgi:alanyl-tRNA synthetase